MHIPRMVGIRDLQIVSKMDTAAMKEEDEDKKKTYWLLSSFVSFPVPHPSFSF